MPDIDWAGLGRRHSGKLGACAEYFARIEFLSRGMDLYTPEVDDHGVDLIIRGTREFFEIQIKSVQRSTGYVFMPRKHFPIDNPRLYLCLVLFEQNRLPDLYLIPAAAWKEETPLLCYHSYDKPGQSSKPEYGLNLSKRNLPLLEPYTFDKIIQQL